MEKTEGFEQAMEQEAKALKDGRKLYVPKPGMKLRRHPIDELGEAHELTGEWLTEELGKILRKESRLPAAQRETIVIMAMRARAKVREKI